MAQLSPRQRRELNHGLITPAQRVGDRLRFMNTQGIDEALMQGIANVYYVDGTNGNDANDGSSWERAKATYLAARTLSNATIDWSATPKRYNAIFVAPGVYTETIYPPYYCHTVGTGIMGTDTAVEFHPAAGSAIVYPDLTGATALGSGFYNIRFEAETAVPVVFLGIANNSIFHNCEFVKGIAGLATQGLRVQTATHFQVVNCRFISGVANFAEGIVFDHDPLATGDKFVHSCQIKGNDIWAVTAGIRIDQHNVASGCLIQDNFIARPAKGIDDNNGNSYCVNNWISATDAIEHANTATQCIANHVINVATGAIETTGTD